MGSVFRWAETKKPPSMALDGGPGRILAHGATANKPSHVEAKLRLQCLNGYFLCLRAIELPALDTWAATSVH